MASLRSKDMGTVDYFDTKARRSPNDIATYTNPCSLIASDWKEFFDFAGLPEENVDILEIGSGMGSYTIPLLQKGYKVCAVDISRESLDLLEEHALILNLKTRLSEVFHGNFYDYNSNKKYDAVLGLDVLHHIVEKRDDMCNFFLKVSSLLKPGGRIIFKEPNPLFPWRIFFLFTPTMSWQNEKGIRFLTKRNISFALEKAGFSGIKFMNSGFLPGISKFKLLIPVEKIIGKTPLVRMLSLKRLFSAYAGQVNL